MLGYPIQPAKVQRPPLRDETLARERLLDWLAARIHHRVILVLADAGYGKTTLLADFSRRTRLRTLWFRLDHDDGDWISFLSHLVAAGKEHDPGFAPMTTAMLSDLSTGGPTRESATNSFLRELPSIAEQGAVLILDDFHLVDESSDVRHLVRSLLQRAPERLSVVFASRRTPTLPLARMRTAGEVAELRTDDLRFDAEETARFFAESYGRDLEPDVLADVAARTEGWAASLQLVQTALRDRSPAEIRRFVRSLTGADQDLYDYLAEEVVGDLPDDLQQFLMRTSILRTVTSELAGIVTGLEALQVGSLSAAAERLTLLSRRTRTGQESQRYHPLVREFLEARLRAGFGTQAVADLHRRVADAVAGRDWRTAAHHYREAGDASSVAETIAAAIPEIMGSGQHAIAAEEIGRVPPEARPPVLGLVTSRIELQRRHHDTALGLSNALLDTVSPGSIESDYALLNLMSVYLQAGLNEKSRTLAERLRATTASKHLEQIAEGTVLMIDAAADGDIGSLSRHLEAMAEHQRGTYPHYFGVTMSNLAVNSITQDRPALAIRFADDALESLKDTSSRIETSAAWMAKAYALTLLGHTEEARLAIANSEGLDELEAVYERADLADSFVEPEAARSMLDSLRDAAQGNPTASSMLAVQSAWYLARRGRFDEALAVVATFPSVQVGAFPGQASIRAVTEAYVATAGALETGRALALSAAAIAQHQGATRWRRIAELLAASYEPSNELGSAIRSASATSPWNLTFIADIVCRRLRDLDAGTLQAVQETARLHPGRWRYALRTIVDESHADGLEAARILEAIGERSDVARLRAYARHHRRLPGVAELGRGLARRLAERVVVEDQGRVSIVIGPRRVPGSSIRRKVLALLCYLLTRSDLASTRDQVLDALWPELDPADALNSLNQTVYFLRRVLEEGYVDDLSPGYLHHDSDLIWLDRELVFSRSNDCRSMIKALPPAPSPDEVRQLVDRYRGRFALDFEYEDWASPYRDWCHASYLEVVERALNEDLETGNFDRGISLARRVLDVDPEAEQVELSLLKLYRASGAHAAAAEQYAHYAMAVRSQLGIEPPPLDSL